MMDEGYPSRSKNNNSNTTESIFSNIRMPSRNSGLYQRRCDLYSVLSKASSSDLGKIRMDNDCSSGRTNRLGGMKHAIDDSVRLDLDRLKDLRTMSKVARGRHHHSTYSSSPRAGASPSLPAFPTNFGLSKEGVIDASSDASSLMMKYVEGEIKTIGDEEFTHNHQQQQEQKISAALSASLCNEDGERPRTSARKKPTRAKSARSA